MCPSLSLSVPLCPCCSVNNLSKDKRFELRVIFVCETDESWAAVFLLVVTLGTPLHHHHPPLHACPVCSRDECALCLALVSAILVNTHPEHSLRCTGGPVRRPGVELRFFFFPSTVHCCLLNPHFTKGRRGGGGGELPYSRQQLCEEEEGCRHKALLQTPAGPSSSLIIVHLFSIDAFFLLLQLVFSLNCCFWS